MKVMVIGLRGFPGIAGGVETHCEHLYPLLVDLGINIEVLTRSPYVNDLAQTRWKGVGFKHLWSPKKTGLETIIHSFIGVLYAAFKRPDILHIHSIGPAIFTPLARILGLKVVVTYHAADYQQQKWGRFAACILKKGEQFAVQYASKVICVSKHAAVFLKDKYARDCTVIPNGVHAIEMPLDSKILETLDIRYGQYFLHVGRSIPDKCQDQLIKAYLQANVNEWKLVLVGDFSADTEYNKIVKVLAGQSNHIIMAGFQTGDNLKALFSAAGMFVLPSLIEGLPIALLEALSAGVPCIASDIPANHEVNLPDICYFKSGNIDELCSKLSSSNEVITEVDWLQLKRRVRADFDWLRIAFETKTIYDNCV